ncbi:MAG: hypothetical protein CMO81_06180 [Waddliaceae bacterium]|nr:hypothetical protein [Waddliaceae bacterium]
MGSQEKLKRLTLDMQSEEHTNLKIACSRMGVSMKEFILKSVFEKLEEIEEAQLENQARETLEAIESGKEKTISWEEMKKRMK